MNIKIEFADFYSTKLLWNVFSYNIDRIIEIRKMFSFTNAVCCKVYKDFNAIKFELKVEIPAWVKGFSLGNFIGILHPSNWIEQDNLNQLVLHEFVHCAIYNLCKYDLPIYIKEGIPLYLANQYERTRVENTSLDSLYCLDWCDNEVLYNNAGILVAHLVNIIGIDKLIELLKLPNFDFEKYLSDYIKN